MKPQLNGKIALITGGALRIGRAIALALAKEGCGVVVHYRSSAAPAAALCKELKEIGVPAWRIRGDLTAKEVPERMVAEAHRQAGRLDILVNSAAIFAKQRLLDVTSGDLREQLETNLIAPVLLSAAFARIARAGHIVNLLDRRIAGHDPNCIPYLLSKKALAEFTCAAALALAPRFAVNGVAPGPVLPPPGRSAAYLKEHGGKVPLKRGVVPEDIARAVLQLVTSRAITGQVIFVDGGQHLLGEGV